MFQNIKYRSTLIGFGFAAALATVYAASCDSQTTNNQDQPDLATAPEPDLASIAPPIVVSATPAAALNTGNATVTLTGQNFGQGATVTIAGVPATGVLFNSSTSLTITTPAKAAFCGAVEVIVTNPDGKSGSAKNILRYRSSTYGLLAAITTTANSVQAPRNLVIADFNMDGNQDVLVSLLTAGAVAFLPGSGNGNLGSATNSTVGSQPRAIASQFLDSDNKLDAVIANAGGGNVSVILGQGNGQFTSKTPVTAGNSPNAIVLRDFDGDGKYDLVSANAGGGTGTASLTIALGNGDGTFKTPNSMNIPVGSTGMAVGDIDGDGKLDLAISHGAQGSVSVLIGNGNATFKAPVAVNAGGATPQANDVVIADFNGDQKPDLAVANSGTNNVSVMFNTGAGVFGNTPQTTPTAGSSPNSLIAVDINEDGFTDLVTANMGGSNLSVMLGAAAGKFANGATHSVGTSPRFLASGDMNNDLQPDLVASNATSGNVSVLLTQCK
ncbi:MAG TPA: FG-GAP-like repeat-containing protein [Pseudomonadota bacterium]|nr:FG-GAP-like repeat-containing protein [Pseudomonadota bacterium]